MEVLSTSSLRVAARPWMSRSGRWTLTVVCKATFDLLPGASALSAHQDPPAEEDTHWDDDPRRSLSAASDLVPYKRRADVVLVGSAYAPGGIPARSILARLCVAELDKAVEAFCDRAVGQDGALRDGPRVTKVPLRYERAAGGPDTWNPAGMPADAPPDAYGMVHLPNLQPPGLHIERRDQRIPAIGFGPIAPTWPARRERLGPLAQSFSPARWSAAPLPEELDPAFFNVAPRDQQLAALREDERILLEGLHPQHARLLTSLPGVRPRAFVERPVRGALRPPEAVPLTCDTLWIDTDRRVCSLVWRGWVPLSHPEEPGRVVISAEAPQRAAAATAWEAADDVTADDAPPGMPPRSRTLVDTYTGPPANAAPALPFRPAQAPAPPPPRATPDASALPFRAPPVPLAPVDAAPPPIARFDPPPPPPPPPARFDPPPPPPPPPARFDPPPPPPPIARFEPAPPPASGPLPPPPPMLGPLASADGMTRAAPEPARPPSVAPSAPAAPPAPSPPEIPIALCAAIAASLAVRPHDGPRVLGAEELTPERWEAADRRWADEIQKESTRGKAALLRAYDEAYVARLEEERGPLEVEEYAALVVAVERGAGEAALAELRLPRDATMRIERVWLDRIAGDPALAKAVRAAVDAAREA